MASKALNARGGGRGVYPSKRGFSTPRRLPARPTWLLLALALWACGLYAACSDAARGPRVTADDLFGERVARLDLAIPAPAMASLAREPREYVEADLTIRLRAPDIQERIERVALRFKGNRSMRSWHDKPAFKLHFAKHDKKRRIAGLRTLVLNNMVEDPTMVREALGYAVFRALELPAPRTGFADVRINGERFGLYAVIEPVEEPLLARSFERTDGPVYEGEYGCDLYEDDVAGLELESGDDPDRRSLRALVEATERPMQELLQGPNAKLNEQHFFGFLAASAVLSDFDGYRHAHNYRLYLDPGSGRFSLIPWGLDRVLTKPVDLFDSHAVLADKCFAEHACRLRYVKAVRDAAQVVAKLDLPRRLDAIEGRIADVVARDRKRPYKDKKRAEKLTALRAFLAELPERIAAATRCRQSDGRELDADGDGHGCMDCDDGDGAIHPGAPEACDGLDNDCSGVADDAASCPCPEHAIEGTTFAICDRPMPWLKARAFCQAQGAGLAHIASKRQAKALAAIAKKASKERHWIGLSDRAREGHAIWEAGTKGYRSWNDGEPDDHACGQDCAALERGGPGRYRDTHCATPLPFICSRPLPQPLEEPAGEEKLNLEGASSH